MAENTEQNGTARPMDDFASDGFTSTGDKVELIGDEAAGPAAAEMQRSEVSPLQMEQHDLESVQKKTQEGLRIVIISSLLFGVTVTVALILTIFLGPPAMVPHGAVSSSAQQCSNIGAEALKKGGSAVDAAIAAMFCIGVVNCHQSGIGGGGFMLIRDQKHMQSDVFDFRETAPQTADAHMLKANQDNPVGLYVAVPGELQGMKAAHTKYGKLEWSDLVLPSVELARNGFNITASLALEIAERIAPTSELAEVFYSKTGEPLKEGQLLSLPELAQTLEDIAKDGPDLFYKGLLADDIVKTVQGAGGRLSKDDLAQYQVVQSDALTTNFNNLTVYTVGAPSGGPVLLLLLNILEGYGLSPTDVTDELYHHRLVEAIKFAYAEESHLGDPKFSTESNITEFISKSFAADLRSKIDDNRTFVEPEHYLHTGGPSESHGTSQVSVIGPEEILVSVTTSINTPFGSLLRTPSGILLNNQMADFDIASETYTNQENLIEGGKRPLSSMCPTVVVTSHRPCGVRLAIGGTNGSRIITGVAEVLVQLLAQNMTLEEAIEAPRIHDPLVPDRIEYQSGYSQAIIDYLAGVGHTDLQEQSEAINLVYAVLKWNESVTAHADSGSGGGGATVF